MNLFVINGDLNIDWYTEENNLIYFKAILSCLDLKNTINTFTRVKNDFSTLINY